MKVAIIGCGLIGAKRVLALEPDDSLSACCDTDDVSRNRFAAQHSCVPFSDYRKLLAQTQCDAVIVAVVNKFAKDIVVEALSSGKHVLAEKPLGRNVDEARQMVGRSSAKDRLGSAESLHLYVQGEALSSNPILKTGFNHRFHPALFSAKQRLDNGDIGEILAIRARYGHGGRPGMEKEWRASKELCGGGELLDQGVHLIDLIRWFGGEIKSVIGKVETKFWDMEVEDSAFAILTTENRVTASFHVSWYNWKNIFSFEIFGKDGYLAINGLGGSYGPEGLEFAKRRAEGGRPDVELFEFPTEDTSWKHEWSEFKNAVLTQREPIANGYDGLMANAVIEKIYESSKLKQELYL